MRKYYLSTKKELIIPEKVWLLLKDCFWSKNVPVEYVERFIKHSLCVAAYLKNNGELVGFARVISDYTTYAYICDVIVEEKHRGHSIGTKLIKEIMSHPELQGLKTWSLTTTEEARKIYERQGFSIAKNPNIHLEINDLGIYTSADFANLHRKTLEKLC